MTIKYQLSTGSKLEFNLASIDTALELFRKVIAECKGANIDFKITDDTTIMDLILKNKDVILNLLASGCVQDAILDCAKSAIYNNEHFALQLFENEKYRPDLFGSLFMIALENLRPFFPELLTYFQPIANLFLKKM